MLGENIRNRSPDNQRPHLAKKPRGGILMKKKDPEGSSISLSVNLVFREQHQKDASKE